MTAKRLTHERVVDIVPRAPDARALERAQLCERLDLLVRAHGSFHAGATMLRAENPQAPSVSQLRRYHAAWTAGGRDANALADHRTGRRRKAYGWESEAIRHWKSPTKPAYATVAMWLRDDGHVSASASRVRRYLQSLPASVGGRDAPARVGRVWHRNNIGPHVVRDASVLPVGFVYQGDGHAGKTHVAHPATGRPWRPEHTLWIDVRSRFIPGGVWLSEAESAISTLHALSRCFLGEDHVPAAVHTDRGSGLRNHLLDDEVTGWLHRNGVVPLPGLPGNPKGQGLVEGWWRWMEERVGKRFETWGGECRTDRAMAALSARAARGDIALPSLAEYADALADYVESCNDTPLKALGGATPRQVWESGLERSPVEVTEAALLRPSVVKPVRRGAVALFGRLYRAPELRLLDTGTEVLVEYELADAACVWVVWKGRRLCEAAQVRARPWLPASRIEDLQAARAAGQRRRLQRKLDEIDARARPVIDGRAAADAAAIVAPDAPPALPAPDDFDDFDPFDTLP